MNDSRIYIIECPSNLGLKKTDEAVEPGVKKLPGWLRSHGFHEQIDPEDVLHIVPPAYAMDLDEESGVRNAVNIALYAAQQASVVRDVLGKGVFQIFLGGDCSILIGNALALRQTGTYGLFFLDGHTDFITPGLSDTAAAAGMDLAIVTGHGHRKLTNINNLIPYLQETHVFAVGNREYDTAYVRPVHRSGINYFDLNALRSYGHGKTAIQFLDMVDHQALDGFLIHLDVDVLSDNIMPAVDSRNNDGLAYEELEQVLNPLLCSPKNIGIEITILDPDLDENGIYTREFVKRFVRLFNAARFAK